MKKSIVVGRDKYFYKGKEYDEVNIRNIIGTDAKFILIDENISIKTFEGINKIKEEFIKGIIDVEYSEEFNILTHYEHNKKDKKLYLYSIGNGYRIKRLINNVKNLEVIPIQFYIKNLVSKKNKGEKSYNVLTCINEAIYYLAIENNLIVKSYIEKQSEFELRNDMNRLLQSKTIIIDNTINNMISDEIKKELNIYVMRIGENINEKISKV